MPLWFSHALTRYLGTFLSLAMLLACEKSKMVSLKTTERFQTHTLSTEDADAASDPALLKPLSRPQFTNPGLTRDEIKSNKRDNLIWLRYPIAPITFVQPTLLLLQCSNIVAVGFDDKIIYRTHVRPDSLFNFANLKKPFIELPSSAADSIAFLVERSPRTGLMPNCADILLSDESSVIREFSLSALPEVMVGFLLLALSIIGLGSWIVLRNTTVMAATLFCFSLAGYFVLGNQMSQFVHLNNREIYIFAKFCLLSAPLFYLLLFSRLLDRRYPAFLGLIAINFALATLAAGLLLADQRVAVFVMQRLYFTIVLLEVLTFLPLILWHILYSRYVARRPFWCGLTVLSLGFALDALNFAFSGQIVHGTAFGVIICLLSAASSLAREFFLNLSLQHMQSRIDDEEFSSRLEAEVKTREENLLDKNQLLEESNSELEEKNVLLRLASKRIDDLLNQQKAMLNKAQTIRSQILPALLKDSGIALAQFSRENIRDLSLGVHRLSSALDPYARLNEESESLTGKVVWILLNNSATAIQFCHALGSSMLNVQNFKSEDELIQSLGSSTPELLLVSSAFGTLIAKVTADFPKIHIVISAEGDLPVAMNFLDQFRPINHLIAQADEGANALSQKNLLVTSTKLISNDIFGLEKYLDWGAAIKESIITGNRSRTKALEQLNFELTKSGLSTTMIRKAHHLADELLMNAIYDAPVDAETQKPRYNHLLRSVDVELEPSEYARFRFGYDGTLLAISIDDPFGALKREIILKYLKACCQGLFGKINEDEGKGGGGMGLFQIMTSADLLVTNVSPSVKTEIIAILNVHDKVSGKGHCFHYFTDNAGNS